MNYTLLTVGEKELKLRLDTRNTVALEKVVGCNPLNELMNTADGGLPGVEFVTNVLHASLQKLEHGYTLSKVYDLWDEYADEGKGVVDILPTLIELFQTCGYIPKSIEIDSQENEEAVDEVVPKSKKRAAKA